MPTASPVASRCTIHFRGIASAHHCRHDGTRCAVLRFRYRPRLRTQRQWYWTQHEDLLKSDVPRPRRHLSPTTPRRPEADEVPQHRVERSSRRFVVTVDTLACQGVLSFCECHPEGAPGACHKAGIRCRSATPAKHITHPHRCDRNGATARPNAEGKRLERWNIRNGWNTPRR